MYTEDDPSPVLDSYRRFLRAMADKSQSHPSTKDRQDQKSTAGDQHQPVSALNFTTLLALAAQYAPLLLEFINRLRDKKGDSQAVTTAHDPVSPEQSQKIQELVDCL